DLTLQSPPVDAPLVEINSVPLTVIACPVHRCAVIDTEPLDIHGDDELRLPAAFGPPNSVSARAARRPRSPRSRSSYRGWSAGSSTGDPGARRRRRVR